MFQRLNEKIQEVGFSCCILGLIKREWYKILQKRYGFDLWHISPYELRAYLQQVSFYIRNAEAQVVVDIGCGLGELLRSLDGVPIRIGYDIDYNVIEAARSLDGDICFRQGSFSEVKLKQPIDFIVTLNFMHGSPEEVWRRTYHPIAAENDVQYFDVDTLSGKGDGFSLDFSRILPENYERVSRMGPFRNGRYVEVYEKTAFRR